MTLAGPHPLESQWGKVKLMSMALSYSEFQNMFLQFRLFRLFSFFFRLFRLHTINVDNYRIFHFKFISFKIIPYILS